MKPHVHVWDFDVLFILPTFVHVGSSVGNILKFEDIKLNILVD